MKGIGRMLKMDYVIEEIIDYVFEKEIISFEVYIIVGYVLLDMLGCGILVFWYFECMKLFGLIVFEMIVLNGSKVLGILYVFDLVRVVFNIGCMICWFDYNDMWLVVEWGYLFDNLGGIFVIVDYVLRVGLFEGKDFLMVCDVFEMMIKVYEI